ncbi:MAG: polymer-forming cytoskeletal protein [Deltaproteobacteria bacterium]|nr:polymer-forming cytoskeletal protein [Deltaproteobacteria bacterium]
MFGKDNSEKKGGDVVGLIGKGMSIDGKLSFSDTVKIDGNFKGEINASGTLIIGESGYVNGLVKVGNAIITGEVKGTLEASSRVELKSPGKMFGDIRTPNLIIGEGVVFEGNCIMVKRGNAAEASPAIEYGKKEENPS